MKPYVQPTPQFERNDLGQVICQDRIGTATENDSELSLCVVSTGQDCWGAAGDIVLFHARIAHTPSHNFGNTIRQAVITGDGTYTT